MKKQQKKEETIRYYPEQEVNFIKKVAISTIVVVAVGCGICGYIAGKAEEVAQAFN